jgi:hypothetical protein
MGTPIKLENIVFPFRVVTKDVTSKNGIKKRMNVSRETPTLEIFKPA